MRIFFGVWRRLITSHCLVGRCCCWQSCLRVKHSTTKQLISAMLRRSESLHIYNSVKSFIKLFIYLQPKISTLFNDIKSGVFFRSDFRLLMSVCKSFYSIFGCKYYIHLTAFFQNNPGKPAPERHDVTITPLHATCVVISCNSKTLC